MEFIAGIGRLISGRPELVWKTWKPGNATEFISVPGNFTVPVERSPRCTENSGSSFVCLNLSYWRRRRLFMGSGCSWAKRNRLDGCRAHKDLT